MGPAFTRTDKKLCKVWDRRESEIFPENLSAKLYNVKHFEPEKLGDAFDNFCGNEASGINPLHMLQ